MGFSSVSGRAIAKFIFKHKQRKRKIRERERERERERKIWSSNLFQCEGGNGKTKGAAKSERPAVVSTCEIVYQVYGFILVDFGV